MLFSITTKTPALKTTIVAAAATTGGGEVIKFGFGRESGRHPTGEFESRPIQIRFFQEKVNHSYIPISPILSQTFLENHPIFFQNFGSNVGKLKD